MITKQKAIILAKNIRGADAEVTRLLSKIQNKKSIKASSAKSLKAKTNEIRKVADLSLKILSSSFKSKRDIIRASKSSSMEKLLSEASALRTKSLILANLLAENEEFNDLPDEEVVSKKSCKSNDVSEDMDEEDLDAEDEESDEEDLDEDMDEEDLDAEDEESDEEDLDAEDEESDEEDLDEDMDEEDIDAEDEESDEEDLDEDMDEEDIDAEDLDMDEFEDSLGEETIPASLRRKASNRRAVKANKRTVNKRAVKSLKARSVKASKNSGYNTGVLERMWNFGKVN